jgi:NADP-dependent 3-hydroxy acid dehydrogenase YdfG
MAKTPRSLSGKVVAITGGARGIGRATAAALIAQGARVAIGDIDAALVRSTAQELGGTTIGLPLDVTDRVSFEAFLSAAEEQLGPLDVLINNAGIMPIGPFVQESDATTQRLVDINLTGVILGSKLALERFIPRRRGHLVNIASSAGKSGIPGGATYSATKHAVVGLSEAIRQEVRKTGIDVSIVMPVVVKTELGSGLTGVRGFDRVQPEDVADAIVEALQTGRVNVYVPRTVASVVALQALLPRGIADRIGELMRIDKVLTQPDPVARAAYARRMDETVNTSSGRPRGVVEADGAGAPAGDAPKGAIEAENGSADSGTLRRRARRSREQAVG